VRVAAQAFERRHRVRLQRRLQCRVQRLIAQSNGRIDRDDRQDPRIQRIPAGLRQVEHQALPDRRRHRRRQRQNHPASGRQRVEPRLERMRHTGVDQDRCAMIAV
jgi:hypothetical protein